MRLGTVQGKACLIIENEGLQGYAIEDESGGRFGPDMMAVLDQWPDFVKWRKGWSAKDKKGAALCFEALETPVPCPRQIFAVGMNYSSHTKEIGYTKASSPDIFTKFVSSLAPPIGKVKLPNDTVDWEVELVVVMGGGGRKIPKDQAWRHVAGLMVGQDLSDRTLQFAGSAAQFSLGKSHECFAPAGPWITTLDALSNYEKLAICCKRNGEMMQSANTSEMVFDIPELIHSISQAVCFFPGDLIFTGTPGGVGTGRNPKVFLKPGDELISRIEGLGEIRQTFY